MKNKRMVLAASCCDLWKVQILKWFRKKEEVSEAQIEEWRRVDWEEDLGWDEALARWKQLKKGNNITLKQWVALIRMLEILKSENDGKAT